MNNKTKFSKNKRTRKNKTRKNKLRKIHRKNYFVLNGGETPQSGVMQQSMVRPGMTQPGMTQPGMVQPPQNLNEEFANIVIPIGYPINHPDTKALRAHYDTYKTCLYNKIKKPEIICNPNTGFQAICRKNNPGKVQICMNTLEKMVPKYTKNLYLKRA